MSNVIVYDVGGTKIATTVIDETGNDLLNGHLLRVATPANGTTEAFVDLLVAQYEQLDTEFGNIVAWGTAFPGPYTRGANGELTVLPRNIPAMRGVNVEAVLQARLGIPGIVDNDMKLALWGEHLIGNAVGYDDVIGVVHSTGVSSAAIQNGSLVRGINNNAGEIGCLTVEYDPERARPCDAQDGKAFGHLEAQIRGPVLAELFFGADRHDPDEVLNGLESADDNLCAAIAGYIVPYLTPVLAAMCQTLEPQLVLLHGSIPKWLEPWYVPALQEALRDSSEAFAARNGQVVLSKEPSWSPLAGAADLAFARARRA